MNLVYNLKLFSHLHPRLNGPDVRNLLAAAVQMPSGDQHTDRSVVASCKCVLALVASYQLNPVFYDISRIILMLSGTCCNFKTSTNEKYLRINQ